MTFDRPTLLMCPPTYYGIEYEINPWMHRERDADRKLAIAQWTALVEIFKELGAHIEFVDPVDGLPDMVFTANAGVVFRDQFVTSHFRYPQRQGESAHFERWFADRGYRVVGLRAPVAFEGAGDALFCGDTLFAGYLHRSEMKAHRQIGELLGCRVLALELVDPRFYHLDTCFCPLAPGTALYYPAAFDEYGERVLRENIPTLIEVGTDDAVCFGCNAVVIGGHVVLNSGCTELEATLRRHGYTPHPTDLSEFLKAGGSAKCLTLRLDGEEAAAWRQ